MKKWALWVVCFLALGLAAFSLYVALQPEGEARGAMPRYYGSFVANNADSYIKLWNGADLTIYSDENTTVKWSLDGATGAVTQGSDSVFEGATADAYETTLTVVDPTADRTITLPNESGVAMLSSLLTNAPSITNSVWGASNALTWEGATADAYETSLGVTDPTADRAIVVPNGAGTIMLSSLATNAADAANAVTGASNGLVWEGATANEFETTVSATDPTADRAIVLPNSAGTVMLSSLSTNAADAANAVTGASNGLLFEGATANEFETTISPIDATADRVFYIPDVTGYAIVSTLATNSPEITNSVWGASNGMVFEGSAADAYETTVSPVGPTADRVFYVPDATGYAVISTLATNSPEITNSVWATSNGVVWEGATANAFETTVSATDPTADRAIVWPDAAGSPILSAGVPEAANSTFLSGQDLKYEGSTANDFEGILRFPADPGADYIMVIPSDTGYPLLSPADVDAATGFWGNANSIVWEGATANEYETTLSVTDPTADRAVVIPDYAGTVHVNNTAQALTANTGTFSGDVTVSAVTDGGNGGAKNEISGLLRTRPVDLGAGTNGTTETSSYVDDSPTGEFAPIDADVTEAEGSVTSVFKFGVSSYHAAFSTTATVGDGFKATIAGDDLEADASIGLWLYPTATIASGDLQILLTDDGGARNFNIGALTANTWNWVEVDITSLAAGTGDVVTEFGVTLTAQGEAALGYFSLYMDQAYKWAAADEEALGLAVLQDGVLYVLTIPTAAGTNNTFSIPVEGTDYFVHYESGVDFIVWISDQSANECLAFVAY